VSDEAREVGELVTASISPPAIFASLISRQGCGREDSYRLCCREMKGRCRSTILEDSEGSDEGVLGAWKLGGGRWTEGFEFFIAGQHDGRYGVK